MKKVINSAPSRRHFLRLTSMAAASALAPTVLCAEQREAGELAASQAVSARIATFEEVWRTVRDRFYDPDLHGLDWSESGNVTCQTPQRRAPKRRWPASLITCSPSCMLRIRATTHRRNQSTTSFPVFLLVRCGDADWNAPFQVAVSPIPALASSRVSTCRAAV